MTYEKSHTGTAGRRTGKRRNLQGYFKQQGLSSEQAAEAIRQYKESQKQKRDDEANRVRNMEQENARLKLQIQNADIDKEITSLAAKEGVSAEKMPFLLKMVERDGIIGQDGKLQSDKAKEALEAVLKAFPEFKGSSSGSGTQPLVGGNGGGGNGSDSATDAALDAIFGIKRS